MDLSCVFFGRWWELGKGGEADSGEEGGRAHIPEMVKYDRKRGQKEKVKE